MPGVFTFMFLFTNSWKYFETVLAIKFVQGDDHKLNPLCIEKWRSNAIINVVETMSIQTFDH